MTALASLEAFAEFRSAEFDPSDVFALRALESASALIRSSLRQWVELVEDDVVILDGLGQEGLLLPQIPVVEVTDVTILDVTDTILTPDEWHLDAAGILWRVPRYCWPFSWPSQRGNVQVTYTHGYAVIPDEAVTLCCSVASRLLVTSSSAGALITSQTIGGASVTYETTSGTTTTGGLTAEEDAILRAYPWPAPVVVEAS